MTLGLFRLHTLSKLKIPVEHVEHEGDTTGIFTLSGSEVGVIKLELQTS
jgi:hypothetical protein